MVFNTVKGKFVRAREARVAFISKPVAASAATARDAYAMASEFAINATDKESLMAAAKEAGYATAFFGKWHLMPIGQPDFDKHYPTSHGFDINVGGREWGQPKGKGKYFSPFGMPGLDDGKPGDFLTDKLTDAAVDFLEKKQDDPFLLYFSYYTLHGPVMAPPALVKKYTENTPKLHQKTRHPRRPKLAQRRGHFGAPPVSRSFARSLGVIST